MKMIIDMIQNFRYPILLVSIPFTTGIGAIITVNIEAFIASISAITAAIEIITVSIEAIVDSIGAITAAI